MKKYLFIDRDGTLVEEPSDEQVDRLDKIRLTKGVIPALLRLRDAGYTFVMVSNQDGLGTDSFPLADFTQSHEFILEIFKTQGISFEQVLICPHRPEEHCDCRKPGLGLVRAYLTDTTWDREHSAVVGDRQSDALLAAAMGLKGFVLSDDLSWFDIAEDLTNPHRVASCERITRETSVSIKVDLDTPGHNHFATGVGFFDHMLDQIATHGGISLDVRVKGDLEVDCHHTIEDTAIVLGEAIRKALGDKRGIGRFGFVLPMDEVYAEVFDVAHVADDATAGATLDISGRPHVEFNFEGEFTRQEVGGMPTEMVPHFFESLAVALGLTLHLKVSQGNAHHQVEALFKAFGRALRQALRTEGQELPSSKGSL